MKKIIIRLLTCLTIYFCFTSCSQNPDENIGPNNKPRIESSYEQLRSLYKEFENLNMNPEIVASKTDSKELYDKFLNAFWKTAIGDHSAGRWVIFGGNDIISKGDITLDNYLNNTFDTRPIVAYLYDIDVNAAIYGGWYFMDENYIYKSPVEIKHQSTTEYYEVLSDADNRFTIGFPLNGWKISYINASE